MSTAAGSPRSPSRFENVPLEIENPIHRIDELDDDRDDRLMVRLLPGLNVESGFTVNDDPSIHKLSEIVLRLAIANFVLGVLAKLLIMIIIALTRTKLFKEIWFWYLADFLVFTALAIMVLFCGIHGVKTRNAKCCKCCCEWCGFLAAFYFIMILAAFFSALAVIGNSISASPVSLVLNAFFLVLQSLTAEYSRRLLNAISDSNARRRQQYNNTGVTRTDGEHDIRNESRRHNSLANAVHDEETHLDKEEDGIVL
uniref:MARVEL domain-containing protein n=1 Tax=Aureoumbra lagunensis TaxID=44058 RepID=A0A7S3JWK1_9STRA|mmetsp:Transcript_9844/g.14998  ORF Transcript_9844/g.14998 Transcript_9844/m.14998 type:complete len:255 (-) Transcript_9844:147-911(-)